MTSASSGSTSRAAVRSATFLAVALLHLCAVFGPLLLWDVLDRQKPRENAFRVKIGAAELSKGPEVGMPERKIPVPPPPAPEPQMPAVVPPKKVSEPRIPKVLPKPKPKPQPKPKPKPKPKSKPKAKNVKKNVPQKKVAEPRLQPRRAAVKPPQKSVKTPVSKKVPPKRKNQMDDVYQDNTPVNINPKVPAGNRNRSQKYAPKADNKAPGGGRKTDEAAFQRYGKNVENYIYSRWVEPSRALLRGEFPETIVEITIEANGRVSNARIIRASSNRAMEESVQMLLSQLDLLPKPPEGRITFQITLKTR